jgi:predicted Mrr-cat superfamily restriction endonuclease
MSDKTKVFIVRAGRNAEREEYCLENNVMVVGFSEYPSFEAKKLIESKITEQKRP